MHYKNCSYIRPVMPFHCTKLTIIPCTIPPLLIFIDGLTRSIHFAAINRDLVSRKKVYLLKNIPDMISFIAMLQTDPDDQYITESTLSEIRPSLNIKYFPAIQELNDFIKANGEPSLILLNDIGTITERGQTLRQLKSNRSYSHIPVVVLGERSSPDYIKECYRAGASTFITKPSSLDATRKKIDMFFSYWFEVAEV